MLSKLVTMLLVVDHDDGFHLLFMNDASHQWHTIRSDRDLAVCFAYKQRAEGQTPLLGTLNLTNQARPLRGRACARNRPIARSAGARRRPSMRAVSRARAAAAARAATAVVCVAATLSVVVAARDEDAI